MKSLKENVQQQPGPGEIVHGTRQLPPSSGSRF
jgi:hypothetical protein